MQVTIKESGTLCVLTLEGELTHNCADELKMWLRRALGYVGGLIVDIEKVSGFDSACLQIICSEYQQSQKLKKKFIVAGHRQELFLSAATASEHGCCAGCGLESEKGCAWGIDSDLRLHPAIERNLNSW